ncbi:DUF998 domain-containing protein [Enterococcus sp. AZ126]|uniref:DUF998 domain-containing protein n=1 Tax=Enterococcus sp. AZ126 TaxID=2774635 RepID=UPI003F683817
MIVVLCSEIIIPIILAQYYPPYHSISMPISALGEDGSPVQFLFKKWQLVNGLLFLLTIPAFYTHFKKTSKKAAAFLGGSIAAFAILDCIVSGLANHVSDSNERGFLAKVHLYGSGIGLAGLLIGVFLLIYLSILEENRPLLLFSSITFVGAVFSMLILSRISNFTGISQRVSLFLLYSPFFVVSVRMVRKK